jgi:hypothetical protein
MGVKQLSLSLARGYGDKRRMFRVPAVVAFRKIGASQSHRSPNLQRAHPRDERQRDRP